MKIGVISDTHIPVNCHEMPAEVLDVLKSCDLILHAGDLVGLAVLECLRKISKVEAVWGNMDLPEVRGVLPGRKVLDAAGKKICLIHGYGHPKDLIDKLKKEFFFEKPDVIVFGHSHMPLNKYVDGILFFNPGSLTDTIFAPYKSYGIIEIKDGKIKAEIIKVI
jgi:uncharacterized protein